MAAQFINASAQVGSVKVPVYAVPANGEKAIVIGLNIASIYGSTLPISVLVTTPEGDRHICRNKRIRNGEQVELMQGNKLVLLPGHMLSAMVEADYTVDPNSPGSPPAFDMLASILKGVD